MGGGEGGGGVEDWGGEGHFFGGCLVGSRGVVGEGLREGGSMNWMRGRILGVWVLSGFAVCFAEEVLILCVLRDGDTVKGGEGGLYIAEESRRRW